MKNRGLIVWLVLNIYWTSAEGNIEQMDRFKSNRESSFFTSGPPSTPNEGKSVSIKLTIPIILGFFPVGYDTCNLDDFTCLAMAQSDRLGLEAIKTLHRQLDDDQDGSIDLTESDDVCNFFKIT